MSDDTELMATAPDEQASPDYAPAPLPEKGEPMIEVRGLWSAFPTPGDNMP